MRRVPLDELKQTVDTVAQHGRKQAARLLDLSPQTINNRIAAAIKQQIPGAAECRGKQATTQAPAITQLGEKRDPPPAPPKPVAKPHATGNYNRVDSFAADEAAMPLWTCFIEGGRGNTDVRKQLVEHYLYIVDTVVIMMQRSLPPAVDPGDMRTAAAMGLMDATMKFDPAMGNMFNTYALPRVRGAVLDFIRSEDPLGRLHRKRLTMAKDTAEELRQELGHEPNEEEVLEKLPEIDDYTKRNQIRHSDLGRLNASQYEADSGRMVTMLDTLADPKGDPTAKHRRRQLLSVLLRGLEPEEFVILYLYYFKSKTMKAIGAALELSESRVSQLHSGVIARLQKCRSFDDVEDLL